MSGPEVHHLFHHPIADHSFSADRQTLAVAKENTVELYARSGSRLTLKDELKGHDKTVTGVDIAPNSGMIVTCSQGKQIATARSYAWIPAHVAKLAVMPRIPNTVAVLAVILIPEHNC